MNENEIVKLYNSENKSTYQIAKIMKTYPNKIRRILIKHGVELKDKSDAQRNAIMNGVSRIPTKGKSRTKEEKLKISKGLTETWKKIDKQTYDNRVQAAKKRWNKMTLEEKNKMQKSAIDAIRLAGKEGSKLEKFLKKELESVGHKVEVHKTNLIPNQNLEIDLYIKKINTVIEVDGPSHFLPIWGEEKLKKQIKADKQKTGLILSKGMAIIRVKHMKDSLSLIEKEKLKENIVKIIDNIEVAFPPRSKRFVEIEA